LPNWLQEASDASAPGRAPTEWLLDLRPKRGAAGASDLNREGRYPRVEVVPTLRRQAHGRPALAIPWARTERSHVSAAKPADDRGGLDLLCAVRTRPHRCSESASIGPCPHAPRASRPRGGSQL